MSIWIRTAAVALVTLAILAYLFHDLASLERAATALGQARWGLLPFPALILVAVFAAAAFRWGGVLKCAGHPLPFRRCLSAILTVWPIALATPSRSGDVLRAIVIRDRVPLGVGAGSVLVERVIDVQVLLCLALIGAIAQGNRWLALTAGLALLAEAVMAVLLWTGIGVARRKFDHAAVAKLHQFMSIFGLVARDKAGLAAVCMCSLLLWLLSIAMLHVLLVMLGQDVAFPTILALWPLALFAGMLPVTIAGTGTRDAAFLVLLAGAGSQADSSAVLAATLCYAVVLYWLPALAGLPLAMRHAHGLLRTAQAAMARRRDPSPSFHPR